MTKSRITVHERPTGLQIKIPPQRPWFALAWMSGWLVFSGQALFENGPLWAFGLGIFNLIIATCCFSLLFGQEIILLTPDNLVHTHGFGAWSKTEEYAIKRIRNLRHLSDVCHPEDCHEGVSTGLQFDYGSQVHVLGSGLTPQDAQRILQIYNKTYHP